MPALEVCDLVLRYDRVTAVDGVTFSAEAGSVVVVLGPNGAGKTSTVETMEGYRRPTSGTARVLGLDPIRQAARLRPRIGVMLQTGGVYPSMSPRDALALFASYYDHPLEPRALLDRVGLAAVASTPWRRLSGGEQQRLNLALALVGRPDVVFLDEPTAGIDPDGRLTVRSIVAGLRGEGVCVLLATHDLDEAERVADRVVILDGGRVVAEGTPDDLRRGGGDGEVRFAAPPAIDTAALSRVVAAAVEEAQPGEYVVRASSPALVAALTTWLAEHDLPLADLRVGRQSLEDVYLRLTRETSSADG